MYKKKNSKEMKLFNYKKLYINLIFFATLFMCVGYASFNSIILNVEGNVIVYSQEGLFISGVTIDEENTTNGINKSNVTSSTLSNTTIALGNDLSSKLTILVNVCNNYSDDRIFSDLRYMNLSDDELAEYPDFSNLYTNNDIVIDDSSYSSYKGLVLSRHSCMDIPVTFKYADNLTTITSNELSATMNFKFDTFDTYQSNVTYAISSTTGTFEDKNSELSYTITVTNNNSYAIKFKTSGSSTTDISLSGTSTGIVVDGNSSKTTTIKLTPAKDIYYSDEAVDIDINVQVTEPLELSTNTYTISVTPFISSLKDIILENTTLVTTAPTFTANVTTSEGSGLFKTVDELGDTYFYRGVVEDNYVYFAEKTWRIVRINGDGTYRLVLDSSAGTSVFSSDSSSTYNVGYMFGSTVRANTTSSAIKTYLEDWYTDNLQDYDQYIDKDAVFWQDRTYNTSTKVYAGWERMVSNTPTLVASNTDDMFSVTTKYGNGKLTKPIGLLTADEVVLAGGTMTGGTNTGYGTNYENKVFYLYTGDYPTYGFWTMTPRRVGSNAANNHMILSKEVAVIWSEPVVTTLRYVRPVINLKADTVFKGSGTEGDPYTIYTE